MGFRGGCRINPSAHLEASVWGFHFWFEGSAAASIILDASVSIPHWSPALGMAEVSDFLPNTSLEPQNWHLTGSLLTLEGPYMADGDTFVGFPRKCQFFCPLGALGAQPEICVAVPRTGHLQFSLVATVQPHFITSFF